MSGVEIYYSFDNERSACKCWGKTYVSVELTCNLMHRFNLYLHFILYVSWIVQYFCNKYFNVISRNSFFVIMKHLAIQFNWISITVSLRLEGLRKGAYEMFQNSRNLRAVIEKCQHTEKEKSLDGGIVLNTAVKPMLVSFSCWIY